MDQGIVTGEGVLLDSRPASFASRALASSLDLILLGLLAIGAVLLLGRLGWMPTEAGLRILLIVTVVSVTIVLPTSLETLTRGLTLGKKIAGIRVVRDDGGPVLFRQSFVRALTGVGELWLTLGSVALITSIVHPQGKRVGDILAGTYAVRVRGKAPARAPVEMPAHLAGWAASAELGRLPDGLALAVRQFLARTGSLHPESRVRMGSELTAEVQRYVAPLPPPGTHPEYFLAAVLAGRRERELAVAARDAARDEAEGALLRRLPHGVGARG